MVWEKRGFCGELKKGLAGGERSLDRPRHPEDARGVAVNFSGDQPGGECGADPEDEGRERVLESVSDEGDHSETADAGEDGDGVRDAAADAGLTGSHRAQHTARGSADATSRDVDTVRG